MAINDVLPPKAARRDAIANFKCFGVSDTRDLILMVTFTFSTRRHLIRPTHRSFHLATFGWVRFPLQRVGSTMQNLRRVGENSDTILSRLWTKVQEIFRRCWKPLVLSNALFSDYLYHVSFRRYSQLGLEIVKNGANAKAFTCEIKHWNNFEIISVFYFTCNYRQWLHH